ncbi:MAG: PLP-dependent transferase [Nitrospirae bacterium]|nr:PLP-dependent transferase [Nitrospirota bacterium]
MGNDPSGFGTKAVHAGEGGRVPHNPSSTPIYQNSTFFFDDTTSASDIISGKKEGFVYTRSGNPTIKAFEDKMAALEGGQAAVAFASGMAAISAILLEVLGPGDEILSCRRIYGGTIAFYEKVIANINGSVKYFGPYEDIRERIPALVSKKTKLIFFETPSNPELSIVDIALIAGLAKKYGLFSVIDNTFGTPYLQRPLSLGIDCVVHSATKYIGGHGDAIGGVIICSKAFAKKMRTGMLLDLGGCLSPFNAWLFLRGLKTLHLRMDRHCETASELAVFLSKRKNIPSVLYPGLKSHPGHAIAKKQMSGFGGMVSFTLENRRACGRFIDRLKMVRTGVSLGDAETIALNSGTVFYSGLSDAECVKKGVDPVLIRVSTGLEDAGDIIRDIEQALKGV